MPMFISVSPCRNATKTGIFALSTDISWHLEQHLFEGINEGSSETTMDTKGSVSVLTSNPQFIKPFFPTTYNPVLKKTRSFWEEQLSEVNTIWNTLGSYYQVCKEKVSREFPGGPVVRTLCFHCCGPGFNLWLGNWDPASCAARPQKTQKTCLHLSKIWTQIIFSDWNAVKGRHFKHTWSLFTH